MIGRFPSLPRAQLIFAAVGWRDGFSLLEHFSTPDSKLCIFSVLQRKNNIVSSVAVMRRVFRSRGDKDCWSTRTATWGQQISERWGSGCIERRDRSDESSTGREQNVKSWGGKGKWDSWAYRKSLGRGFFSRRRRWREGWEEEGEGYLWGAHSDIAWALAGRSQRDG